MMSEAITVRANPTFFIDGSGSPIQSDSSCWQDGIFIADGKILVNDLNRELV
jgi:hypothetical protein